MTTTIKNTSLMERFKHLAGFRMDGSSGEDNPSSENDDEQDPNSGNEGGGDSKSKKTRAEEDDDQPGADDEGDDDTDAEDEEDKETAKARARERGRCAAIVEKASAGNLQQALFLAFGTNISRKKAVAILKTSPQMEKSSPNKMTRFNQRMANHRNQVSQIAPSQTLNPEQARAQSVLKAFAKTGKKVRG